MNDRTAELGQADQFRVRAAEGWVELGNPREANLELDTLTEGLHDHPEVLQVRWHIHSKLKEWERCVQIGRTMTSVIPDVPLGWINHANALFYLKRFQEAYDVLLPALKRFPKDPYIPYNLACYQCQLGNAERSIEWFKQSLQRGDASELKDMALIDPDLKPIWREIAAI